MANDKLVEQKFLRFYVEQKERERDTEKVSIGQNESKSKIAR